VSDPRRMADPASSRRRFVASVGLGTLALTTAPLLALAAGKPVSVSIAEAFDREVEAFMRQRKIPGGALAVVKEGRLVYAKGYGWADRKKKIRVQPASLFRIASISKPITAVAVLKLVEEKRLDLDARAFELLQRDPSFRVSHQPDARLGSVTIRQLLHHTGGWDRDKSFDPMFRSVDIARDMGEPPPAQARAIIRYMLGRPLNFDPGARYAYSNFGYCVLGRVIERVTGRGYEDCVRENILAPIGVTRMRLGRSRDGEQAPGEARYYARDNEQVKSVFPPTSTKVPVPYGGFCLEAMDAHGGWIASAVDLARFAAALDDPSHSPLLKPETLRLMYAPPVPPVWRKPDGALEDAFYACGWMVRPVGADGRANYWHAGSLPGTATLLVRRWDGLSWAVLFNQRSEDKKWPDSSIDAALHRAADAVTKWPANDLFHVP